VAGRDVLFLGMSQTDEAHALLVWAQDLRRRRLLHEFLPDYHRLQLERWIFDRFNGAAVEGTLVVDVGVASRRDWIGPGYRTFNVNGGEGTDYHADLMAIPFDADTVDAWIVSEVLEHCEDPKRAMGEIFRTLKPGGLVFATSPFFWPWHGTTDYPDLWRFTHEGWARLFAGFEGVAIVPTKWTDEGLALYSMLRRFEAWGFASNVRAATGYLCEGRKPGSGARL